MSSEICGFSFPFRIHSGVLLSSGEEKIKHNLIHLLLTDAGERVMSRDYGGGLRQLLYDPNNDAMHAIVQYQLTKAIGQWEPRIQVRGLDIIQDKEQIIIQLRYEIRQTQQRQSLDIPIGLGSIYG